MSDPRQTLLDDYRMTFGSVHGKRVLADLKKIADRAQIDLHSDRAVDPLRMACLEGHRQCYLRILAVVDEAVRTAGMPESERQVETYLTDLMEVVDG